MTSTLTAAEVSNEERIRAGALDCVARFGLSKTTLDDVARASGVSRATIYRVFPGGKDVLLASVLGHEVDRFFDDLAGRLDACAGPEELLVTAVGTAMRFLRGHEALRTMLRTDPDLVVDPIESGLLAGVIADASAFGAVYLAPYLDVEEVPVVAEHVVRTVLSYTLQPSAHVDPDDDGSIRRFVRRFLLPAITPDP